ncbi:DUF1003 domain-containing protein [Candidatus Nomurabacteria bacterium]|nr:MAG: DUF1003 domain-containing protein [Candidatus Nomurabacteria bacterium]
MHFPNRNERNKKISHASDRATKWIGSTNSLVVHTIFFAGMLVLAFTTDIGFDKILLVLTTLVSLEAIYLSIFIQMTVNKHSEELEEVSEDIEEIQEDVDEIQENIEDIQEDVEKTTEEKRQKIIVS